eukprot:TRINITY_DN5196_c0_g1_i2.p1 TRINITY_DN5196_c0_g1~~TRINITY_DN5196_c0_g1_i2.p1  ORF type:complete len:206 (-),score=53.96 TRINITY_DN5196_c0_g1_i2:96-713(-)
MFLLMRYVYRSLFHEALCFTTILGLDGAGKTTILNDIKKLFGQNSQDPNDIMPTIGQNVCKGKRNNLNFTFRDAAGIQKFRRFWENSYAESHAIVFVVDCSSEDRLNESVDELRKVVANKELSEAPICILAHKQDVAEAITPPSLRSTISSIMSDSSSWIVIGSSCRGTYSEHFGIDEMINWVTTAVKSEMGSTRLKYMQDHPPV